MSESLRAVRPGRGDCTVTQVRGSDRARRRLAELGVRPGAAVRVVQRAAGGGIVLAVGPSRLALDRRTAADIDVEAHA